MVEFRPPPGISTVVSTLPPRRCSTPHNRHGSRWVLTASRFPVAFKNVPGELTTLSTGFNNVDCSNGTCDGCSGTFGFDFESAVVATAESGGTINLTLVRLAGTDGEVSVTVDVVEGNATISSDYGGTWPTQVCVCAPAWCVVRYGVALFLPYEAIFLTDGAPQGYRGTRQ